ncbi:hypothetical protein DFH28DRAFT_1137365 [Melampsora americana]|nr:hypothetical protein DFH28DRAFT_1137365 [Melampsora americana]
MPDPVINDDTPSRPPVKPLIANVETIVCVARFFSLIARWIDRLRSRRRLVRGIAGGVFEWI